MLRKDGQVADGTCPLFSMDRDIPLTEEAIRILEDVKKYNEKHNLTGEWIFQSNNANYDGRLSYDSANNKLRKLCIRLGADEWT